MNPNDYTSAFAGLPDPSTTFMQGVQNGAGIQQLQLQQQQAATAQQQQAQMQADLAALSQNPTTQAIGQMSIKYPQLSESFKRSFDMVEPSQRQARLDQGVQVYSALHNKQPEIAIKLLNDQAEAQRNSGNEQDAKAAETMAELIKVHPEFAQTTAGLMLASALGPDKFTAAFPAIGGEVRAQELAPEELRKAKAGADTAEADVAQKQAEMVGQTFGALQGKNAKPAQVKAAIGTLFARKAITADQRAELEAGMPADPKDMDAYLGTYKMAGMKPADQMKYTNPDANTVANNKTQVRVQQMITDRQDAKGDTDPAQIENIAQMIASRRMAPLGQMAMRSPAGIAIMARVAELNPDFRAQDFGTSSKAEKDFATGKQGNAVRSFNVALAHLDTLDGLVDALHNKDTQAINRIGNYFATQTGNPAPTNFEAAKKIVGDEIVKSIVGSGGGVHDREEAARTIAAASGPAQLKGVIKTYKELMVGQLGGLEQQYRTTTGRDDFHKYLAPQAVAMYGKHGAAAAPAGPAVGTIDGGFRFKGGDPSQKSNWEPVR